MKNLLLTITLITTTLTSVLAAPIDTKFFDSADAFFKKHVVDGKVNYNQLNQNSADLKTLLQTVAEANIDNLEPNTRQAFLINTYNLLVIQGVLNSYPLQSVLDVNGFFDSKKHTVAGKSVTLNKLEKEWLIKTYQDARFHFVLVCGALDCPPITNFAYRPNQLNQQLEQQTRIALNNPDFIKVDMANKTASLSQIFEWYVKDFGGSRKASLKFINQYRKMPIPSNYKINFYNYNWSLNKYASTNTGSLDSSSPEVLGNNSSRYVVSSTIPKGTWETKIFNNLYTQRTTRNGELTDRSTFLTITTSVLYGLTNNFNIGYDSRYRFVSNHSASDSPLSVINFDLGGSPTTRQGLTGIGPKIRYAPFKNLPNFSIQSAYWFSTGDDLEGTSDRPFIDWNGDSWFTQVFNDFSLGESFSLFTEIDFFLEDIGPEDEGHLNRFSTPATVILSYFPNPKTTLYTLSGYSPFWQEDYDYFAQLGAGAKYQFTPQFELELLYTYFTNEFLQENNGRAATYNLGIRYNL